MPKPEWLKIHLKTNTKFLNIEKIVRSHGIHTVCEEALCPNRFECWDKGTATFLIMGNICTRSCGFCSVKCGRPLPLDPTEPLRIAKSVKEMGLSYVVITSVDRDDLPDGGAEHWAKTIKEVRKAAPSCKIEVLVPDFKGNIKSLDLVLKSKPNVFSHNLETVPRLYPVVRKQAKYIQSLKVLEYAKERGWITKTGIMVGLGEKDEEIKQVMKDAHSAGVKIFTIGQYLQPTNFNLPVFRYVHPEEFEIYKKWGDEIGFALTISGPLVRSSYFAEQSQLIFNLG